MCPLFSGPFLQCLVLHSSVPALEQVCQAGDRHGMPTGPLNGWLARPKGRADGEGRPQRSALWAKSSGLSLRQAIKWQLTPSVWGKQSVARPPLPLPSEVPERATVPSKRPCALTHAVQEEKGGVHTKGCSWLSATWSEPVAVAGCAAGPGARGGGVCMGDPPPRPLTWQSVQFCSAALLPGVFL